MNYGEFLASKNFDNPASGFDVKSITKQPEHIEEIENQMQFEDTL